jgi:signal transduction histidine kinase
MPAHLGERSYDRLYRRTLIASVATAGLIVFLIALMIGILRSNFIERLELELDVQTKLLVVNAREGLNLADFVAKQSRSEWLESGKVRPHAILTDGFPNYQGAIVQIAVIDAKGYLSGSSLDSGPAKIFLGDRPHFTALKNVTNDQLYISKPVVGRISGLETVQVVRPILTLDRKFSGVVVVSLDVNVFLASEIETLTRAGTLLTFAGEDGITRFGSKIQPDDTQFRPGSGVSDLPQQLVGNIALDDHLFLKRITPVGEFPLRLFSFKSKRAVQSELQRFYAAGAIASFLFILAISAFANSTIKIIESKRLLLKQLHASNVKANSANYMKSKFVVGISHELRTPLNGILGFAELAQFSETMEDSKRYSGVIFNSAQKLHQLVGMLLDLAKIEAGQMSLTLTKVKTEDFFQSLIDSHRDVADGKGLALGLSVSKSVPGTFLTDRIKLMQVIDQVIGNAVRFTESGAVFVNVESQQGSWSIKVMDTGIGMTEGQVKHAFDRFGTMQRIDSSRVTDQGPGLGLSLSRELLELLGGTIDLQSEMHSGTTVLITFKEFNE